jgi:hypothetical protein
LRLLLSLSIYQIYKEFIMKIQSLILAGLLSLAGTATFINTAFADTPATTSITATCNDGTSFTGTTKQGACSGHKGVKNWADAKAPAVVESKPVVADKAAPTKATTAAKPAATSTMAEAPGGGPGKVWVNNKSKKYHCLGTEHYGKTKDGSYMTEAEAKAKGNHAVNGKACG